MSALSRSLLARYVLSAVGVALWACAVWRLAGGAGGPAAVVIAVLGWGLGLIPVHVTLSGRDGRGPYAPTGGRGRQDERVRRYRHG